MDIHALLRRLRAGESDRAVARALGLDRKTVGKYHTWAHEQQLLDGPLPELAELHARLSASFKDENPPQNHSPLEAYRGEIQRLVTAGKKPRTIYQLLSEQPGFTASESAVWRMVRNVRPPKTPEVVTRLETAPGEVAQVDFGDVGLLVDPRTGHVRRAYVFTLVLGWSRHMYAEFVFDQKIPTGLQCHQHAFEFCPCPRP